MSSMLATLTGLSQQARKGGLMLLAGLVLLTALAALPFLWQAGLEEQARAGKAEFDLVSARVRRMAGDHRVRLTAADHPERMFVAGATAGTTLAAFQSLVSAAAVKSGLSVLRMQPLPAEAADGLSPYRLSVDATASIEQLRAFLADAESTLPIILVTGFEIAPRSAAGPAEQPYPSEDLAVSLRLEAFGWEAAQ